MNEWESIKQDYEEIGALPLSHAARAEIFRVLMVIRQEAQIALRRAIQKCKGGNE